MNLNNSTYYINTPTHQHFNTIKMRKKKFPRESFVSMTELVLPNDTNTLNNLMGGRLMHWMDIVSAIAGQKHSNSTVVTASVDNISFKHPIRLGNVVTLKAMLHTLHLWRSIKTANLLTCLK
jgi:acyl-CoA hydrolase